MLQCTLTKRCPIIVDLILHWSSPTSGGVTRFFYRAAHEVPSRVAWFVIKG